MLAMDSLPLWAETIAKPKGNEILGATLTQLLQEKLILGSSVLEGTKPTFVVRLNPEKIGEIKTEIGWDWKYWAMLIVAVLAAIAGFLALRGN